MIRFTAAGLIIACLAAGEVPGVLAIRGARVYPGNGPAIDKGTVVVRNGLIEAVGTGVAVPADAWVIDGAMLTVYLGLIDGLSTWGIPTRTTPTPAPPALAPAAPPARGPEDRPSTTSWIHAQDQVQPNDRSVTEARNSGYTMAVTFPTAGIFAGQGAALNLAGEKPGQMTVAGSTGMYISTGVRGTGTGFPGSLMGVIAYIRQVYIDADHYAAAKQTYQAGARGMRRPDYDRALEGVLESPRILLPASRRVEMERMIRLSADLKRKAVLYGGHEGFRAAEVLKASGVPLLVSLRWPERARDSDPDQKEPLRALEVREGAASTPAVLAKQGVKFAFYSAGVEPPELRRAVKKAIDAGLSVEDAVRALSLNAAEIHGFADRAGSIEPGKIANLTIADGDLFQDRTRIKYVIIDGVKYEPAAPRQEATP